MYTNNVDSLANRLAEYRLTWTGRTDIQVAENPVFNHNDAISDTRQILQTIIIVCYQNI